MGHEMLIDDKLPKIKPLKTRVEAILKLEPPKTVKQCRSFCGMVNYLSMFLKELQIKLIPIYHLTRKGVPFYWGEEQQKAFDEIKQLLVNPPVLTMPNETGHLVLVSDTSKVGCGGALYQFIDGQYRLLAYHSKKLPEAVTRYSISELELTGMLANISAFKHILKNAKFTVYSDHSALVHIVNSKKELPTLRLKKLVEHLHDYDFTINFMKGKELHVTDFLSRNPTDDENPYQVMPISFLAQELATQRQNGKLIWRNPGINIPQEFCHNFRLDESHTCERCTVVTRRAAKDAGANIPPMYPLHGETRQPEKSKEGIIKLPSTPSDTLPKDRPNTIPTQSGPLLNSIKSKYPIPTSFNPMQNIDLPDQLPKYDIGELWDTLNWEPTVDDVNVESKPLFSHLEDSQIFRRHIPKADELEKFIEALRHKIIHDFDVPLAAKELRAEYPTSPFFKDIYNYISKGICRFKGKAKSLFKTQCEDYFIADGILFKRSFDSKSKAEPQPLLCIPEKYIPTILHQFHDAICVGHPGILKLYEAIKRKYYFHAMFAICEQYVTSCYNCQSAKGKTDQTKIHYVRIPIDYNIMSRFSMDVKQMPPSKFGFTNLLVCTDEYSHWVEAFPIANQEAQTIADALYFKIFSRFGTPKAIICDEAPAFTSNLMKTFLHCLNVNFYYVSPMNHGSLRTERYIRTLNDIMAKQLEGTADMWPIYVQPTCFTMNCQISVATGFSPYEIVYHVPPPKTWNWEINPDTRKLKLNTIQYLDVMKQRKQYLENLVLKRQIIERETDFIREMRSNPDHRTFKVCDLVYLYFPYGSKLKAPSRKLKRNWIGPLRIMTILDDTHYLVGDMKGRMPEAIIHFHRLKPYFLNLNYVTEQGILHLITNYRQLLEHWRLLLENKDLVKEWQNPNHDIYQLTFSNETSAMLMSTLRTIGLDDTKNGIGQP